MNTEHVPIAVRGFAEGWLTCNEARKIEGLPPISGENANVYQTGGRIALTGPPVQPPNKEFPRGSRDAQALRGTPEGADWNDVSDWPVSPWKQGEMADSSHPWNVNRIVRTRTGWAPAGPSGSDVAVIPPRVTEPLYRDRYKHGMRPTTQWLSVHPFAYGLSFLLLLWACMALNN